MINFTRVSSVYDVTCTCVRLRLGSMTRCRYTSAYTTECSVCLPYIKQPSIPELGTSIFPTFLLDQEKQLPMFHAVRATLRSTVKKKQTGEQHSIVSWNIPPNTLGKIPGTSENGAWLCSRMRQARDETISTTKIASLCYRCSIVQKASSLSSSLSSAS